MSERSERDAAPELVRRLYPGARPAIRRVLAALLTQRGCRVFVRVDLDAAGVLGYLVGRVGVLAVVIADEPPDTASARRLLAEAADRFSRVRVSGRVVAAPRLLAVQPDEAGGPYQADGPYEAVRLAALPKYFDRLPRHLNSKHVAAIADAVALPGYVEPARSARAEKGQEPGLLDADELREDEVASAMTRPFADWLTFLHPAQRDLVDRNWSGPARISGPAGTGKTVVALHRLRHLARRTTGPLLFTTFVRTLPTVHRTLFQDLAPEVADRVEFVGVHAWARRFLAGRGIDAAHRGGRVDHLMGLAWKRHRAELEPVHPFGYWKTEIDAVIKGRGIGTAEEYLKVARPGRGPIRSAQREAVWRLYEDYQASLEGERLLDHNDVIERAWREVADDGPYAAVVVDEVQDISLVGLRLLHRLAGNGPNRLLLVGDGQQQVYPGGWRLSEAGISVQGRGAVLRVNYRNSAEVLRFAQGLDATNVVDDLDGAAGVALQDAEAVNGGGRVRRWAGSRSDLPAALVEAVRTISAPPGRTAVIVLDWDMAKLVADTLRRAGVAWMGLEHYTGEVDDRVKVGTVRRAKGLDFQAVLAIHSGGRVLDAESRDLLGRQLMVAATRARDELWWGEVQSA